MKKMKLKSRITLLAFIAINLFMVSCNREQTKIDYKNVEGYFVLNTIKNSGAYEKKFTNKEDFDKYFGIAQTMNSSPTNINFDNEFVAAYIMPIANVETTVYVDSVIWNGHKTEMWLSIETGDSLSYSFRPTKMLIIDKKYDGDVTTFVTSYGPKENN